MKSLVQFIQEKLTIKKSKYNYFPKSKEELQDIIKQHIEKEGPEVDLNDIDVSNIIYMSNLFDEFHSFNGDISDWDVSNVIDISYMFSGCKSFNGDISDWDVSNVKQMNYMFYNCKTFDKDISNWNVSNVKYNTDIFYNCKINRKKKYKPVFK